MNYDDIMMGIEWLNGFSINRYFIDGILVGNGIYYMMGIYIYTSDKHNQWRMNG